MVSEDNFQAALDADPTNSSLRLVFADWLEERGDARAEGYRWLGRHGKWPYDWGRSTIVPGFETFDWYLEDGGATWDVPGHCRLPAWFRSGIESRLDWPAFASRREAEDASCAALSEIPEALRIDCTPRRLADFSAPKDAVA